MTIEDCSQLIIYVVGYLGTYDHDIQSELNKIKITSDPKKILNYLGWDISNSDEVYHKNDVAIVITKQDDFGVRKKADDVAPSYTAISELGKSKWAILTNGKKWRLYSNRVSASSTNYFEITLDLKRGSVMRYLPTIFGSASYITTEGRADIDLFFDEGRRYATDLEVGLSTEIMRADGIFIDIVKGVLDHNRRKTFSTDELEEAKQISLKIMYRIWFLAYAESRDLLPTRDVKYNSISLQKIHSRLDSYESEPNDTKCWSDLLKLFAGIRNGSPKHNLPQYDGELFSHNISIDGNQIKNRFIVDALRGLLEKDGEAIDYANLSVRHLGNIFETLMEFSVRQAEKNIMLLEGRNGVREVQTRQEFTYSYQKNDLYLASKGGIVSRKTTASYYTPDKIVEFLVGRGLEPILEERQKLIDGDLKKYKKSKSTENLQICMDRLLDIQVLDPTMGSGHFLVEALNQITSWATDILKTYPDHPLLNEIESERHTILSEQRKKKITINENLLTHDVLLKRKVMKRCIFGVDINPMAVELTKLSLWLDSFAIGVPLTYLDHHIKAGDSTIGMFLSDLENKNMHTLDDWVPDSESNQMICEVVDNPDITIDQVRSSKNIHKKYKESLEPLKQMLDALTASKIEPDILPKKGEWEFIHRFGKYTKNESKDLTKARNITSILAKKYQFFHWELEMMDAFTDSRKGFDLILRKSTMG